MIVRIFVTVFRVLANISKLRILASIQFTSKVELIILLLRTVSVTKYLPNFSCIE
jgi:hypothetical protein